jgi:hypothetical protein
MKKKRLPEKRARRAPDPSYEPFTHHGTADVPLDNLYPGTPNAPQTTTELLTEATDKIREMIALCDRQRAELRYLRSALSGMRGLVNAYSALDESKVEGA